MVMSTLSMDQKTGMEESHICVKNKVVPVFANVEAGERCVVEVLDFYISKLSEKATDDIFYKQLLSNVPYNSKDP